MHEAPALQLLRLVHINRIRDVVVGVMMLKVHNRAAFCCVVPQDVPERAVIGPDLEAPYFPVFLVTEKL